MSDNVHLADTYPPPGKMSVKDSYRTLMIALVWRLRRRGGPRVVFGWKSGMGLYYLPAWDGLKVCGGRVLIILGGRRYFVHRGGDWSPHTRLPVLYSPPPL